MSVSISTSEREHSVRRTIKLLNGGEIIIEVSPAKNGGRELPVFALYIKSHGETSAVVLGEDEMEAFLDAGDNAWKERRPR